MEAGDEKASAVSVFSALRFLKLMPESEHTALFGAVAQLLRGVSPAADLDARFGLLFSSPEAELGALLLAVKAVLSRAAARSYEGEHARGALCSDITAAGLSPQAAEWTCQAAEAAVAPCAAEIRRTQAHAAMTLSSSYLEDFDWQARALLRCCEWSPPLHRPAKLPPTHCLPTHQLTARRKKTPICV